ncbi:DinB family protein [Brevibacillus dissolubilis]|uniref:DinB family protein n=1 Tax=Brevibacillus dissolubilis TaxID=1844116 RepID=UPI00159BA9AF|nr:DinB family protein [Brevibacillus dissolubilis]
MEETMKTREDIWATVSGLTDEQLNERVEPGKWTIMQVLEHLYLYERVAVQNIAATLAEGVEQSADQKPYQVVLNREMKVDAPEQYVPSENFITLAEIKSKLDESRQALLQTVEGQGSDVLTKRSHQHRIFGLMDLQQWISFIGLHEKRHLAQIEELKGALRK